MVAAIDSKSVPVRGGSSSLPLGTRTELNGFFKARRWDARSASHNSVSEKPLSSILVRRRGFEPPRPEGTSTSRMLGYQLRHLRINLSIITQRPLYYSQGRINLQLFSFQKHFTFTMIDFF